MSQGGAAVTAAPVGLDEPGAAGSQLHAFIRQGRSFSGRERNCAFLNLGASRSTGFLSKRRPRYADISGASGFEFPDDARALGRVDWDHDGDLDVWSANRSGPQVRFLRNDAPRENHFLAVQLKGIECNRDAIGARVTVRRSEHDSRPLTRTLRAGEGFLSQSSKWLHFGLGQDAIVTGVEVRWPGGATERFDGAAADGHYVLEQGTSKARPWNRPGPPVQLTAAELKAPAASGRMRLVSDAALPVPDLDFVDFDGNAQRLDWGRQPRPRATLVVLWASWCAPCAVELRQIASREEALRAAGVEVVALTVEDTSAGDAAARLVEKLSFPFVAGRAPEHTIEVLRLVNNKLFDYELPLPVPVSFLMDAAGTLAVIYRGAVGVDRLVTDAKGIARSDVFRRREALPFPGRWLAQPGRLSPYALAWDLIETIPEAGLRYLRRHRALVSSHQHFAKLAVLAGNAALGGGRAGDAAALYRDALSVDTRSVDARNNLAWLLSTHPDGRVRNGEEALHLAESALRATNGQVASVWDTLAAAHAELAQWERAVAAAKNAVRIASQAGDAHSAARMSARLERYTRKQPFRSGE